MSWNSNNWSEPTLNVPSTHITPSHPSPLHVLSISPKPELIGKTAASHFFGFYLILPGHFWRARTTQWPDHTFHPWLHERKRLLFPRVPFSRRSGEPFPAPFQSLHLDAHSLSIRILSPKVKVRILCFHSPRTFCAEILFSYFVSSCKFYIMKNKV